MKNQDRLQITIVGKGVKEVNSHKYSVVFIPKDGVAVTVLDHYTSQL